MAVAVAPAYPYPQQTRGGVRHVHGDEPHGDVLPEALGGLVVRVDAEPECL